LNFNKRTLPKSLDCTSLVALDTPTLNTFARTTGTMAMAAEKVVVENEAPPMKLDCCHSILFDESNKICQQKIVMESPRSSTLGNQKIRSKGKNLKPTQGKG